MERIIQENYIDEQQARTFLNDFYRGIDLLPSVPEKLTREQAAAVLSVSLPTVDRMLSAKSIALTKQSILTYVMKNMVANSPVIWGDEENTMSTQGIPMTEQEKDEWQQSFKDVEESIDQLYSEEESGGLLFTEEDLKQN